MKKQKNRGQREIVADPAIAEARAHYQRGHANGVAHEREECAKRLEALADAAPSSLAILRQAANDIRARGKA